MRGSSSGLERFAQDLDQGVLRRVRSWHRHPGLRPLLESLHAQHRRRRFLDLWAEAMVADRLQRHGCVLEIEVETPAGRTCDMRVEREGVQWFLHVKRLDDGKRSIRTLEISPRLRVLEHIQRPLLVHLRWAEDLSDDMMQDLVVRASTFLEMARIGDELTVRDPTGFEVGGVRVVGPSQTRHISLAIGLPEGFIDETPRIRRLFDRAYRQFMPKEENVILVVGSRPGMGVDFEAALLGAVEERWDAHPAAAGRAAHGRAADGFWSPGSRPESQLCGCAVVSPRASELRISTYTRDHPGPTSAVADQVEHLFSDSTT